MEFQAISKVLHGRQGERLQVQQSQQHQPGQLTEDTTCNVKASIQQCGAEASDQGRSWESEEDQAGDEQAALYLWGGEV